MFRRIGEVFIVCYLRIGIHFERINSARLGQPVINPRISAQAEYTVDAFRQPLEFPFAPRLQLRRHCFEADLLLVLHVPFYFSGGDGRRAVGKVFNDQLPGRVRLQILVPDDADVNFAPLDVLLDYRRRHVLPVDELHALLEFLVVADNRSLGYADRAFVAHRLNNQRVYQPPGRLDFSVRREDGEAGHAYAVVRQNLIGQSLVARQRQPARVAARVFLLHQLQEADHVLVEVWIAVELFEQVEGHVRLTLLDGVADHAELATHPDRPHLVPHVTECGDNVILCPPLFLLLALHTVERFRLDQIFAHQHNDAQFSFSFSAHNAIL